MAKYQVRIEDYEFDQSFTLDELLNHGLLDDYDPRIQVRAVGERKWVTARQYPYDKKEKEHFSGFTINADGSVTRHTVTASDDSISIPSRNLDLNPPQSSTPTDSSGSSSSDNDWLITIIYIIGKFVLAIIVIGIISAILAAISS